MQNLLASTLCQLPDSHYIHHVIFWQNMTHHQARKFAPVPLDLWLHTTIQYSLTHATYCIYYEQVEGKIPYYIADFYCEDFNMCFGHFAILKFATYFITWNFVYCEAFSTCKIVVLEHFTTSQVLIYVHNSLLMVYYSLIS